MYQELMEFLACPKCKDSFELDIRLCDGEEIISGSLFCKICAVDFPIEDGIPRMVENFDRHANSNFEYYWNRMEWNRPKMSQERFFQFTGWGSSDIREKIVLEAGCGGGRWAYQFAHNFPKTIIAFDYTTAIETAKSLCSGFKNIHYVQADIMSLPFKAETYDLVHCHGVLHAMPNLKEGLSRLSKMVKPRGQMAILIYRNLSLPQKIVDGIICGISKQLPIRIIYYLSALPTLLEYIPGWRILENIIHLSGQPYFVLKHLHNFDWYSCKYRHRTSAKEGERMFTELEFTDIMILDTNHFRTESKYEILQRFKEYLLDRGFFLKSTLGIRGSKEVADKRNN